MASFPTYSAWLGSRPTSLALRQQYNAARDAFERGRGSRVPWDGGGDHRGLATGTTDPAPSTGRTGPPTRRFPPGGGSTSGRGSGVPWDGGGDHRGLVTGTTDPVPPSGGGGGGGRTGLTSSGRGSFGASSGPSGYTGVDPRTTPMPRPGSMGSGSSGFGETRAPVGAGKTSAAGKGASVAGKGAGTAAKGASAWSKAGTVVGKALNSPAGKMARWAGKKVLLPIAGAKAAGDLWGAFEPGIDTLRYGHQLPYKDGVGGRDNRVNDLLGNISPLEAIKEGKTQEVLSSLTGGLSDKALKAVFPYRERPRPVAPAPATTRPATPATTRPTRPSAPAPQQPGSLRGIGEQARGQSKAVRNPDDYLGSAFDATLRKGIDTGRNYLRNQMNKDGLDAEQQSKIMDRYNTKIADDKELSKEANKGGIINTIKAKDEARAGRTLEAYRGQRGEYRGNTSYAKMQEKYVK